MGLVYEQYGSMGTDMGPVYMTNTGFVGTDLGSVGTNKGPL